MFTLLLTDRKSIFHEKDYLDYRYFHKRAYYLTCIATGIEEAEDCTFTVNFAYQNDNHLQPIIILGPGHDSDDFSRSNCQIRIILAADGALFPLSGTALNKNCVRTSPVGSASTETLIQPTPFYNASLRSECSTHAYLKYLHQAASHSEGFTNACILGNIWLRQRGLKTGLLGGGFGSFEWACTMALLMQGGGPKGKPVLSKGYSGYQLFKAVLQYLSINDLVASPAVVQSDDTGVNIHDQPVMFDCVRGINVLFKMTPWSYAMLRVEAAGTLKLLNDPLVNHIDACFITNLNDFAGRFDAVIDLPANPTVKSSPQTPDAIDGDMAYCRRVYQALVTGLGDRILLLHLRPSGGSAWLPVGLKCTPQPRYRIRIGILVNPQNANRTVDRGPSAEDHQAATAFRKFWGEKAELRRFKDGSIQESLIWPTTDPQVNILKQIVVHVIRRHIGERAVQDVKFFGDSFDRLLGSRNLTLMDSPNIHQPVMRAFESLEKDIRSLQGLPLQIRQISVAGPLLDNASTKFPFLDLQHGQMVPANVYVQFEGSGRWPDEIVAVQRTKMAFLLKTSELLEATTGLVARLGLENTRHKLLNSAFLDILAHNGAFFRLRIHNECESNLLEKTLKDKSHTQASRGETASALSTYKRNFIQAPLHSQAVRKLSTRFPLLSPSIRLMKNWRNAHLLSRHISDELIELLTIHTFVHPHPWSIPGSLMTGFLRTLRFVSKWDWRSEPVIVDLNDEMGSKEIDAIDLHFEAWRKIDPAMNRVVMFAASNLDPYGITWTELGPSKVVATRFSSLARVACGLVEEHGVSIAPEVLFAASMIDYDFVLHLDAKFTGNQSGGGKGDYQPRLKNLQIQEQKYMSLVGFTPVQSYLEELETLYGSNVIFFYNEQGGSVITGLWNPQTGPRSWKINLQYSTMPTLGSVSEEAEVTINKTAVLLDIARLGGDMVSRVEIKR